MLSKLKCFVNRTMDLFSYFTKIKKPQDNAISNEQEREVSDCDIVMINKNSDIEIGIVTVNKTSTEKTMAEKTPKA